MHWTDILVKPSFFYQPAPTFLIAGWTLTYSFWDINCSSLSILFSMQKLCKWKKEFIRGTRRWNYTFNGCHNVVHLLTSLPNAHSMCILFELYSKLKLSKVPKSLSGTTIWHPAGKALSPKENNHSGKMSLLLHIKLWNCLNDEKTLKCDSI